MLRGLGNLATLLRQARQVSGKMQSVNERLKGERVTGSTGGGMVEVEANGLGEVLRVRIDPTLMERGEREMIEDLLAGAVNQALTKSRQCHLDAMRTVTEGLDFSVLEQALSQLAATDEKQDEG